MDRISKLCSYLFPCETFADVGCDHGYCSQYMLKNGLCQSAVISDVSEKSLNKAIGLLSEYIAQGRCKSVCCDGLEKIDRNTELVLIAGMGGEEIIKILKNSFVPKNFVFQPMKNAERLRRFLIESGCQITHDDIFYAEKYYFVITGKNCGGSPSYSEAEYKFGKNSLKNPVLKQMLKIELEKKTDYLTRKDMSAESKKRVSAQAEYIKGVLLGEIR